MNGTAIRKGFKTCEWVSLTTYVCDDDDGVFLSRVRGEWRNKKARGGRMMIGCVMKVAKSGQV